MLAMRYNDNNRNNSHVEKKIVHTHTASALKAKT